MKKSDNCLVMGCVDLFVFVLFTVLVKTVDVQAIGPLFSKVGFASVNRWFFRTFGSNDFWYRLSEIMGYGCFLVCAVFAGLGAAQLFERKGIKGVDRRLYVLGGLYVVVLVLYLFFDKAVVVNCAPVLEDLALKPSYPSSHTMLAVCVMSSAADQVKYVVKDTTSRKIIQAVLFVYMCVLVLARMLSGMHWLTDIVGALILSASVLQFYKAGIRYVSGKGSSSGSGKNGGGKKTGKGR